MEWVNLVNHPKDAVAGSSPYVARRPANRRAALAGDFQELRGERLERIYPCCEIGWSIFKYAKGVINTPIMFPKGAINTLTKLPKGAINI